MARYLFLREQRLLLCVVLVAQRLRMEELHHLVVTYPQRAAAARLTATVEQVPEWEAVAVADTVLAETVALTVVAAVAVTDVLAETVALTAVEAVAVTDVLAETVALTEVAAVAATEVVPAVVVEHTVVLVVMVTRWAAPL